MPILVRAIVLAAILLSTGLPTPGRALADAADYDTCVSYAGFRQCVRTY